jgi:hypothetical protein
MTGDELWEYASKVIKQEEDPLAIVLFIANTFYDGYSITRLAEMFDISPNHARRLIYGIRNKIAKAYAEDWGYPLDEELLN